MCFVKVFGYLLLYINVVSSVVGRKFAYSFRDDGTEQNIWTKEVKGKAIPLHACTDP
jgi:hypothetical protein